MIKLGITITKRNRIIKSLPYHPYNSIIVIKFFNLISFRVENFKLLSVPLSPILFTFNNIVKQCYNYENGSFKRELLMKRLNQF